MYLVPPAAGRTKQKPEPLTSQTRASNITTMDPVESKVVSDVLVETNRRLATCKNAVERAAKNLEWANDGFVAARNDHDQAVMRSSENLKRIKKALEAAQKAAQKEHEEAVMRSAKNLERSKDAFEAARKEHDEAQADLDDAEKSIIVTQEKWGVVDLCSPKVKKGKTYRADLGVGDVNMGSQPEDLDDLSKEHDSDSYDFEPDCEKEPTLTNEGCIVSDAQSGEESDHNGAENRKRDDDAGTQAQSSASKRAKVDPPNEIVVTGSSMPQVNSVYKRDDNCSGSGKVATGRTASSRSAAPVARAPRAAAAPVAKSRVASSTGSSSSSRPSPASSRPTSSSYTRTASRSKENIGNTSSSSATATKPPKDNSAELKALQEEISNLKSINTDLQTKLNTLTESTTALELSLQTTETERGFYFDKLRGIEIMLQIYREKEENGVEDEELERDLGKEAVRVIEKCFRVMYAAQGDDVNVDEEGNVSCCVLYYIISCTVYLFSHDIAQLIGDDVSLRDNDANLTRISDSEPLLTEDSIDEPTENNAAPMNQFSDDNLEDDELLVDDEPEEQQPVEEMPDVSPIKPSICDEDSIEDDNLLSD